MIVPIRVLLAAYWVLLVLVAGVVVLLGAVLGLTLWRAGLREGGNNNGIRTGLKSGSPRCGIAPPVRWPAKVGTDWTDEEGDVTPEGLGPRVWRREPEWIVPDSWLDASVLRALRELERERQS